MTILPSVLWSVFDTVGVVLKTLSEQSELASNNLCHRRTQQETFIWEHCIRPQGKTFFFGLCIFKCFHKATFQVFETVCTNGIVRPANKLLNDFFILSLLGKILNDDTALKEYKIDEKNFVVVMVTKVSCCNFLIKIISCKEF